MKQLLIIIALFFSLTASSQQIVLKVEGGILVQDTAAMMAGYLRSATASGLYLPIGRLADSTAALRTWVNAGFPAMQRFLDSIAAVRGAIGIGGSGSVTSVGMSVPTGLQVANSPITSTGTLAVTFQSGYSIPTTAKQTQWDAAYNASTLNSYLLNPVAVTNYDSLLFRKNDSVAVVRLLRAFAGSNKVTVSKTVNDTSLAYSIDVNEANLNVANLSNYNTLTTLTGAQVVTNKEIVRRVLTESGTSASVNIDNYDVLVLTNAAGASLTITGTPYDGQVLEVIGTNGGSITSVMVAPPTIDNGSPVVIGTYRYYRFQYDAANTTWVNVAADRITQNDYNKLFTLQTSANPTGTITHDANNGSRHRITFTGSGGRTLAFSNITNGYLVTFYFDNTSGGAITLTLPSNGFVQNSSGVYASAASISIPVGKTSVSLNLYDGTNYWYTTSF